MVKTYLQNLSAPCASNKYIYRSGRCLIPEANCEGYAANYRNKAGEKFCYGNVKASGAAGRKSAPAQGGVKRERKHFYKGVGTCSDKKHWVRDKACLVKLKPKNVKQWKGRGFSVRKYSIPKLGKAGYLIMKPPNMEKLNAKIGEGKSRISGETTKAERRDNLFFNELKVMGGGRIHFKRKKKIKEIKKIFKVLPGPHPNFQQAQSSI